MRCTAVRHAKWTHATQGSGDAVSNSSIGLSSASVTQKVKDGWQPSDPVKVAALLEPKLTTMSQADFSNGYHGISGQTGQVVDDIIQSGNGIEPDITVTGPASQPSSSSQTTDTVNNTTTTTTINNTYNYAKESPIKSVVTNTQNTTVVTVNNTTGAVTNNATTTQTGKDIEVCGLPGKPACKMDETGTPAAKDNEKKAEVETAFGKLDDALPEIAKVAGKDTGWGLKPFWLTAGTCQPVVLMTLPAFLKSMTVGFDLCPLLPMIYTLMNLLWITYTFFAITSMVSRVTMGASA